MKNGLFLVRARFRLLTFVAILSVGAAHGLAADAQAPTFRFGAIADTHISNYADIEQFRNFLHTLNSEKMDFLLILGDICGHAPELLAPIKDVIDGQKLPVHVVPGNHDDNYGKNTRWYTNAFGAMAYSFDHKGIHFVMYGSQQEQLEWLQKDLGAVPAERPIIFCQHYPPPRDGMKAREPWKTLLLYPNAKLGLCGHLHFPTEMSAGQFKAVVLDNCFMNAGVKDRGSYYVCDAYADGSLKMQPLAVTELRISEPPDKTPTVKTASPAEGDILAGQVAFRGTAADDQGVQRVEYSIDYGKWIAAEGKTAWTFTIDSRELADGHHLFTVRAIDSTGQPSVYPAQTLCLVENKPASGGRRFQQGVKGYTGCTDVTVRAHGNDKNPNGSGGDRADLENWIAGNGAGEFSEFYIRFDLKGAGIPPDAAIERVRLTLFASRQNGMLDGGTTGQYRVGVLKEPWNADMAFERRPTHPGWMPKKDNPPAVLTGRWPCPSERQIIWPPTPTTIDLTPLAETVASWVRNPESNHGLVFSPASGKNYNFSAQSSLSRIPTVRPLLEIWTKPRFQR